MSLPRAAKSSARTATPQAATATRTRSFVEAIREATEFEMARDDSVVVFGLDVDDPKAIQGTTLGLPARFGAERCFGTPLSEDAMTGAAIGMALAGLRPIHVHIRMDFLLLAVNQLLNVAAKSRYTYGGRVSVPMVVRAMIGKSWGQGAQHSQGLHSFFMHVPGIKVVAPSTPYDAKGALAAAVRDDDPVLRLEEVADLARFRALVHELPPDAVPDGIAAWRLLVRELLVDRGRRVRRCGSPGLGVPAGRAR